MIHLTPEQFAAFEVMTLRANPPEVMSVRELALYLGICEDVIRAKTQEGEIPHKPVGTRILYYREPIRRWLAAGNQLERRKS